MTARRDAWQVLMWVVIVLVFLGALTYLSKQGLLPVVGAVATVPTVAAIVLLRLWSFSRSRAKAVAQIVPALDRIEARLRASAEGSQGKPSLPDQLPSEGLPLVLDLIEQARAQLAWANEEKAVDLLTTLVALPAAQGWSTTQAGREVEAMRPALAHLTRSTTRLRIAAKHVAKNP